MKKLMVSISVVFLILTTGCEMRTTSKQQSANERTMSIVGTPVHEKDYKISDIQVNNHEQSNYQVTCWMCNLLCFEYGKCM